MELIDRLKQAMIDLEDDNIDDLILQCIKRYDVNEIIENGLSEGIRVVGALFEEGEYFLPELMLAAEMMKTAMERLEPLLNKENNSIDIGIVIGTVHGDIHDIGKTLVGSMLTASGYTVYDLGSDTPVDDFIDKIRETSSQFLCLSALLTTTMNIQREIISRIRDDGIDVRVLVGGAPVNQRWADEIGADGYAENAVAAVKLIDNLVGK